MKKIPMRKCMGCMQSKPKTDLCRIVKDESRNIIIDKTGKKAGRGAYICYDKACVAKIMKSKKIERELECEISEEVYSELKSLNK